jgi:tetratricopeptide (TPR) repeat protein
MRKPFLALLIPAGLFIFAAALLLQLSLPPGESLPSVPTGGPVHQPEPLLTPEPASETADLPNLVAQKKEQLALNPESPKLYYQIGLLYAVLEPDLALAYLEQAAALDPALGPGARRLQDAIVLARLKDEQAYTLLESGRVLAGLGEWKLAAAAFQRAVELRPDYAEAWAFLGEAYQQLPDQEKPAEANELALAALQRAVSLDPHSLSANLFIGLYWKRTGRLEAAMTYLLAAERQEPANPAVQVELGSCTAEKGNVSEALVYYQKAASLAPKDPTYWRALAAFTLQYKFQVREVGLPAARQSVILLPEDPRSLDVLGQVFYALEDLDSALRFLKQALEHQAEYAPSHLHLGRVYLLKGDASLARRHLQQASLLAPGSPTADQAERLLAQYFP